MKLRILSMFLALITVVAAFSACGNVSETTAPEDETAEPVVTDAPDTNAPETNAPETDAPETDAPETIPVVSEPEPEPVLLDMNFDTELSVADYIAGIDGIDINAALNGGDIKDGKWVYNGRPLAIKDDKGIYELNYYSVEFDFCFNSFVNKDNTSVFSFIVDDDGVLNGESSFYVPFKINMDGTAYHSSATGVTFQIEQGRTYHYKMDVDNVKNTMTVYVDDNLLIAPRYNQALRPYRCFRIMDGGRGADMWVDNLVILDTEAAKNASTDKMAKAVDGAYVRAGSYADEVLPLAEGSLIDIKYSTDVNYYREGLVKFDISKLVKGKVGSAFLQTSFSLLDGNSIFDLYWASSNWESKSVTYDNMPLGKKIIGDIKFSSASLIDFSPYINEALDKGDKYFTIRIVPTYQSTDSQTRLNYSSVAKPYIVVYPEALSKNYMDKLIDDEAKNKALWDYAQTMYDEWYARYKSLPAANEDAVRLGRDDSQYIKTNYMSGNPTTYNSSKTAHKSRPFAALTDFDEHVSKEFKNAKLDKYGGVMIESLKQKATGFFYTTKIDGRWWIIDPLGYTYIAIGLSDIHYSQLGSKLQKENALKLYGDYDSWALATTRQVVDELYFNNSFRPVSNIIDLEDGMPFGLPTYSFMGGYGSQKGLLGDGNGSTIFLANNTMPVFDPDFVSFADTRAKDSTAKYIGNDRLIGYMTDNELPMNVDMLDRAMTIAFADPANHYTYACTWTWLRNITGKDNPSYEDLTDELRDLYRGFVWDRYFYVVANAIKKYDPDHMYLGTRFLTISNKSEWVYRFSAQYLDCMTINWYFDWEPDVNALYGISRNGDMPFIVTEFYTKAGDSGLGNTSGAGRFVATQTDRADYYETFVIRLLESPNCVGWQWFQYMDNDPNSGTGDLSSVDSNKGIYRSDFTLYTEFTDRMKVLNKNVYNIIDYFENKSAK